MFEGFADERIDVGECVLRVRHGGLGPPVLLVHGHPRTGATWHGVASLLVQQGFTVVCPDMRGYGQSTTVRSFLTTASSPSGPSPATSAP